MSAAATQPTPHGGPGPHGADTQGSGQVLQYIINVGADFVRLLHEQALAHAAQQATVLAQHGAPPAQHAAAPTPQAKDTPQATDAQPAPAPQPAPPPAPDALIRTAASFDQIARAVRRTIALAQSLNAPKQQPATPPAQDRTTARRRILRAVEDVIQRPPDNDECDDAETLLADLYERMDAPDLDDDIATRPPEDIIKEILRDLGLAALPGSRPWKRRTQADIAGLNAHAAAPASPARSAARPPGPGPQDGNSAATGQPAFGPEPDGREPGPPKPAQPEPAKAAAARSAARPPRPPRPHPPRRPGRSRSLRPPPSRPHQRPMAPATRRLTNPRPARTPTEANHARTPQPRRQRRKPQPVQTFSGACGTSSAMRSPRLTAQPAPQHPHRSNQPQPQDGPPPRPSLYGRP